MFDRRLIAERAGTKPSIPFTIPGGKSPGGELEVMRAIQW